ncbi:MAG: dicarboxylate/amino acid:cation symporter [Gemmatimonadales bacterium]
MKKSLTLLCILGLVLGIAAGIAVPRWSPDTTSSWLVFADGAVRLWTNALRLVVTPLVVAQLFVAISAHRAGKGEAAKLGFSIPGVFVGLLVFTALCAIAMTVAVLGSPIFENRTFTGIELPRAEVVGQSAGAAARPWVDNVIPSSLVDAAARPEAILGLMLFALAFGVASRQLKDEHRRVLETGFDAVRDTLFVLIGWLVRVAPIPLFALGFRSASNSGLDLGEFLAIFLGIEIVVLLVCIAAQYPLATIGGGVSLLRFAQAAFPAQVTAAATRSSLATVPVLLRESEQRLGTPSRISALVIPLGGATLKLSRLVSSPVKLLVLAHFLNIPLGPGQIVAFAVTILALSPSTVGVPSVIAGTRSLPAFVAAGIPAEYVILLGATTAIVDVFLTVLNTTGYLTASVLVARLTASRAPARKPMPAGNPIVSQTPSGQAGGDVRM